VKHSRDEADSVLELLSTRTSGSALALIDDVRAEVFLDRLRHLPEVAAGLEASKLNVLLEQDREHGTAYVESLRAFLDHHGDFAAAAAAVCVHPNTLRYRIRRASSIACVDLSNPDERLMLSLQLRTVPGHPNDGSPEKTSE
jgi:DNA-binding PucR family transcriptional regulator